MKTKFKKLYKGPMDEDRIHSINYGWNLKLN